MISPFLFWVFASLMLIFGAAVVINRNPVASALSLVVSFLALAALFISLNAYFLGVIQVLVYAGAIMVLFLFIIMLLDLRAEELRKINWIAVTGGGAVALTLVVQIFAVIAGLAMSTQPFAQLPATLSDDVRPIGLLLFTRYNLPFQIIGVVILVATVGVVMLSRRQSR
jgi:NADH-quinone oxidoreductase subunit J